MEISAIVYKSDMPMSHRSSTSPLPFYTGGSVDEVRRNRAQAPVSKYIFGLISNIINCTDTFYTFFGPGKLPQ